MTRRTRTIKAHAETGGGIAYDLLAQELLQRADFQQLMNQLGNRLRQELLQQLVRQPLQQLGTGIGQQLQNGLLDAAGPEAFALSDLQIGALLRDLLDQGEKIL